LHAFLIQAITHSLVLLGLLGRLLLFWAACRGLVVLDMPLLFETGCSRLTRPNVVVNISNQDLQARTRQHSTCGARQSGCACAADRS
jgi:hypothetical protein